MLYKKYHRNFVRRFRRGTRFKFEYLDNSFLIDEATREPYYYEGGIYVSGNEDWWILVYSDGVLSKLINNVIQEIS